jgi:PAS domain-containing protein
MTVPEACSIIQQYFQKQLDAGLVGDPVFIADIFPESQDPVFTQDLIRELQTKIIQRNSTAADLLGVQESLAFLGTIQRTDCIRKCSRIERMATNASHKLSLSDSSDGAMVTQLASIGSKVDSEFIADLGGIQA